MRSNELVFLRRSFFLGALTLLISTALGCGGGKGTVTGKVTLDGKPLPGGKISFVPSKGAGVGAIIKDGEYSATSVPAGDVKITVETQTLKERLDSLSIAHQKFAMNQAPPGQPLPEGAKEGMAEEKKQGEEMAKEIKELKAAYRPIPEKYSKADSSGLSLSVKPGVNPFDITLSSK